MEREGVSSITMCWCSLC